MPYSFHLVPRTSEAARVQINHSILTDALTPPKVSTSKTTVFSPEDVFELWCEPQAVFRVRSVGRCSATLSGRFMSYMLALSVAACLNHAGHASPILCCAHSPTGRYAATGSGDATCRVWDMDTESPKVCGSSA